MNSFSFNPNKTYRALCFTLNLKNYLNDQTPLLDFDLVRSKDGTPLVRYAIYQLELSESGTHHYQGYVEFARSSRAACLSAAGLEGAHFEQRRGTPDEARDYCRKEDTRIDGPFEYGDFGTSQGARTDWVSLKRKIDSGATEQAIADDFFGMYIKFQRGINAYRNLRFRLRDPAIDPVVILYYGPSGCGKSSSIAKRFPNAYWKPTGIWFDGYDPSSSEAIVLDDFSGHSLDFTTWKHLCDRYPMHVQIKGSTKPVGQVPIVLSSTVEPQLWWDLAKLSGKFQEVQRRITEVHAWCKLAEDFIIFNSTPQQSAWQQYQNSLASLL